MKRTTLIFSLVLLLFYVFAFQGARGIYESTEGRYSNVAYLMVKTGDWMHPKLHLEQPHWTKPPLYYWATALSIKLFGQNTFAVRFPGALAFLLTLVLLFQLGKVFTPERPWLPSLIYASYLLPITASNSISTDNLLTFLETAAMTCVVFSFWYVKNRRSKLLLSIVGGALWGLSFLTKGPPGLLPLFGVGLLYVFNRKALPVVSVRRFILGITMFLIFGGFWFLYVIIENPDLIRYFLWDEVAMRVASNQHHRNSGMFGAFIVYIPTLVIGMLPWTIPSVRGFFRSIKEVRFGKRNIKTKLKIEDKLLLFWIIMPLFIFFFASSRLPLYIQPLFVPLAIVCSREISPKLFNSSRVRYLLISWAVLMVMLRGISGFISLPQDSRILSEKLQEFHLQDFTEIVFVDAKPHYGLSLYLDVDIKRINFQEEYKPFAKIESLEEELKSNDHKRIWLVPKKRSKKFQEYVEKQNIKPKFVDWIDGKKTYGIFVLNYDDSM